MALVPAICTQCGAQIEVDNTLEAGVCKHCGTAFVTEKVINNYSMHVTNNIANANINVVGANVENLLILAENAEKGGNSREALNYYTKVLEQQPENVNALIGKAFASLYSSSLRDMSAGEVIRYVDLAVENLKDKSQNENTVLFASIAYKLLLAGMRIQNAALEHVNKFWGLKDVAIMVKEKYEVALQLFLKADELYVLSKNLEDDIIKDKYLFNMQQICKTCVYLCKPEQYKNIDKMEKYQIPGSSREVIVKIYDRYCAKIKMIDTDYVPEAIMRQEELNQTGGCYIATCVYGSYDCPEVWTLRRFRDYTLDDTWYGRLFIKCYYAISPTIVKWFGNSNWFRIFWKSRLDKMVSYLQGQGIDDTEYKDKY